MQFDSLSKDNPEIFIKIFSWASLAFILLIEFTYFDINILSELNLSPNYMLDHSYFGMGSNPNFFQSLLPILTIIYFTTSITVGYKKVRAYLNSIGINKLFRRLIIVFFGIHYNFILGNAVAAYLAMKEISPPSLTLLILIFPLLILSVLNLGCLGALVFASLLHDDHSTVNINLELLVEEILVNSDPTHCKECGKILNFIDKDPYNTYNAMTVTCSECTGTNRPEIDLNIEETFKGNLVTGDTKYREKLALDSRLKLRDAKSKLDNLSEKDNDSLSSLMVQDLYAAILVHRLLQSDLQKISKEDKRIVARELQQILLEGCSKEGIIRDKFHQIVIEYLHKGRGTGL